MKPEFEPIAQAVADAAGTARQVAAAIHQRPELCFQEHFASQLLAQTLREAGLEVEMPLAGMDTAFRARFGQTGGPKIAILAEYDALPEIGHACGHNLIAGSALAAALGLAAAARELPGEVILLGTPAEEGGGGKVKMIKAGVFAEVDAAMMFHPFDHNVLTLDALAIHILHLDFKGIPSHAAAAPWDGASALSGVIQTFNMVDNARLHFRDGTRVHGIITNGGQAYNIIPENASATFCLRAKQVTYLDEVVVERVMQCARAAAQATGTEVSFRLERGYQNMLNNLTMARRFGEGLQYLGQPFMEADPASGIGSTDMGDVSQVVPAIHPYLAICAQGETLCHQHRFAALANSDQGYQAMMLAAQCLAYTAYSLLAEPELLAEAKAEFKAAKG